VLLKAQLPKTVEKVSKKGAIEDLNYFVEAYLGYTNNWHHKEWYDILQNKTIQDPNLIDDEFSRKSLIPNKTDKKNLQIIVEAPREHAKSTCFAVNYALWELYKNNDIRIIIVSRTRTA